MQTINSRNEIVPEEIKVPEIAYFYKPTDLELKSGKGKSQYRNIYEGDDSRFDEFELGQIKSFEAFLHKKKYEIDRTIWTPARILRYLQATQFKFKNSYKSIIDHSEWLKTCIPAPKFPHVEKLLQTGILYVHGRDSRFRPIIVYNPYKFNEKEMDKKTIIDFSNFFFDYITYNMLLPGKIENWVVIMDLNKMGVTDLPYKLIKEVNSHLQTNFRNRMFVIYMVNAPAMISVPWKICKGFLEETTVKRVNIQNGCDLSRLFTHANRSQVEEKFGGTAQNVRNYCWPPKVPSKDFFTDEDKMRIQEIISPAYFESNFTSEKDESEEFGTEISEGIVRIDGPFEMITKYTRTIQLKL